MNKPTWWPENPYPSDIFVMPRSKYEEIVPDPDVRTALSGMLGKEFWEIASDMIWERLISQALDESNEEVLRFLGMEGRKENKHGRTG